MANSCPKLTMAVPTRLKLETIHSGTPYKQIFTGFSTDTNNFDTESVMEWVENGTYHVGDWVKIDALKMKYLCGVDGTNAYPPDGGADWFGIPLTSWSYRDSTPTRQSIKEYVVDENIVVELTLSMQSNFLFVQNMENINAIKVESIGSDGNVISTLDEKDLFHWVNFDCCNCCQSSWDLKSNYSLFFSACNQYNKIRITFFVKEDVTAKVGTCAIGTSHTVGRITKYVAPNLKNTKKLEENPIDKKLDTTNGVSYGDYSVSLDTIGIANINNLNRILLENQSLLCYFDLGFDEEDLSVFMGFYNDYTPTIGGIWEKPLSLKINVTLKQKGV